MSSGLIWLTGQHHTHVLPSTWGTALAGHRDESWRWLLLDRRGNELGVLDGVVGGSLDFNINADTRGSGQLRWVGWLDDMPDWPQVRIQPVYTARFPDGTGVEWPMGVYLPATPSVTYGDAGMVEVAVSLYDKTLVLRQDALEDDLGVPAGADPVAVALDHANAALNPLGTPWAERDHPIFESTTARLRNPLFFEAGTSVLALVNALLDVPGYFATWADGTGTVRSSSYVRPAARPVAWSFNDGQASIYTPDFDRTQDLFDAPNKLVAISRGDGDAPALTATAIDIDPASPLSYPSRGRWVAQVLEGVEATSQEALEAYAARRLADAQDRSTTFTLKHAPVPLAGNDRVQLRNSSGRVAVDGVVQAIAIDTAPGALWTTVLREVKS